MRPQRTRWRSQAAFLMRPPPAASCFVSKSSSYGIPHCSSRSDSAPGRSRAAFDGFPRRRIPKRYRLGFSLPAGEARMMLPPGSQARLGGCCNITRGAATRCRASWRLTLLRKGRFRHESQRSRSRGKLNQSGETVLFPAVVARRLSAVMFRRPRMVVSRSVRLVASSVPPAAT